MTKFDFDIIEEELDLVVPDIFPLFVNHIESNGYAITKYLIYHDTESLIKGNWLLRLSLEGEGPPWLCHYLNFGVGDDCGNHFFLQVTPETEEVVQL